MKQGNTQEVIAAFVHGEEAKSYQGNLKSIKLANGDYALLGYGWAIYATNHSGQFYFHPEWYGYSPTTSKHYNAAHSAAGQEAGPQGVCISCEGKPRYGDMKD